jgi:hypothetical protein
MVRFLELLECNRVIEEGHPNITTAHDLCPGLESILPCELFKLNVWRKMEILSLPV